MEENEIVIRLDKILTKQDEILKRLPEKRQIGSEITQRDINQMYGKSDRWFLNIKRIIEQEEGGKVFEGYKKPGSRIVYYEKELLILTLRRYGYEQI